MMTPALLLLLATGLGPRLPQEDAATQRPGVPSIDDGVREVQQLREASRHADAAQRAERGVREHPDAFESWLELARCHLVDGWTFRREVRAREAAVRASELAPAEDEVLVTLAVAHYRLGEYDAFEALVPRVLGSSRLPGAVRAELLTQRAQLWLRRAGNDAAARDRVRSDLREAVLLDPIGAPAHLALGEMDLQEGSFAEALPHLLQAVQSQPGNKQTHYHLRVCYQRLGQKEAALRHLEIWKLLQRLTDSQARVSAPDLTERRQILRELRDRNPRDAERRAELVRIEIALGDLDAGQAELDRIKKEFSPQPRFLGAQRELEAARAAAAQGETGKH